MDLPRFESPTLPSGTFNSPSNSETDSSPSLLSSERREELLMKQLDAYRRRFQTSQNALTEEVKTLRQNLERTEAEKHATKCRLEAEIETYVKELASIRAKASQLESRISTHADIKADLTAKTVSLEAVERELRRSKEIYEDAMADLNRKLDAARSQVAEKEKANSELRAQIEEMSGDSSRAVQERARARALEAQNSALRAELEAVREAEAGTLSTPSDKLAIQELELLRSDKKFLSEEVERLRLAAQEQSRVSTDTVSALQSARDEAEQLRAKVISLLERQSAEKESAIEARVAELRQENARALQQVRELGERAIENQTRQLTDERDALRRELNRTREDLDALRRSGLELAREHASEVAELTTQTSNLKAELAARINESERMAAAEAQAVSDMKREQLEGARLREKIDVLQSEMHAIERARNAESAQLILEVDAGHSEVIEARREAKNVKERNKDHELENAKLRAQMRRMEADLAEALEQLTIVSELRREVAGMISAE